MESKAKAAGHAIHPMLIVLPLGLLWTSLVFDIVERATGDARYAEAAFLTTAAGVIGGLIAGLFGLIDYLAIPKGTRARRVGFWHAIGNDVFLVAFGLSWLLRLDEPNHRATGVTFALAIVGVVVSAVTGWLGGELVERLGVSVYPDAHLDAPSSLRDLGDSERVIDLRDPAAKESNVHSGHR